MCILNCIQLSYKKAIEAISLFPVITILWTLDRLSKNQEEEEEEEEEEENEQH